MTSKRMTLSVAFIMCILIAPFVYIMKALFEPSTANILPRIIIESLSNTLIMMFFVALFTVVLGTTLAWLINVYEFKGRTLLQWLILAPLGFAPYIMAQSYADLFSFTGIISSTLRNSFNIKFSIDFLNLTGAIFIFTMSLFPYVYLMCHAFYNRSAAVFVDNARLLGKGGFSLFFSVGFPIARVPIIAGVSLVLMETLSDYGVVSYYGIRAFTTIFYKIWIDRQDFSTAMKLALVVLVFVFLILLIENFFNRRKRYHTTARSYPVTRIELPVYKQRIIQSLFIVVMMLSFGLPFFQLLYNNYLMFFDVISVEYLKVIADTFVYSSLAAIVIVVISFFVVHFITNTRSNWSLIMTRIATLGYSIPGVLIAIVVMYFFHDVDRFLVPFYRMIGIEKKIWIISSSAFVLIFAYTVRFLAVGYNQLYGAKIKYSPEVFYASRTLGKNELQTMFSIEVPLLKRGMILGFLLVFLEVIKELPITLLLKPRHLTTLTMQVNKYYVNEMIKESSIPALMIVLLGLAVLTLVNIIRQRGENDA